MTTNKMNIEMYGKQSAKKNKTGKKTKWFILLFLVMVLTVTVLWAATRNTGQTSSKSGIFTVRSDNLTITVTEAGSIRAHKSLQYKCEVETGRQQTSAGVTILKIAPPGTVITKQDVDDGMVLVELDSSALKDRLVQEKMSLASNGETVTSTKEAYDSQIIDNESSVANAALSVRFGLLDLQKYLGEDLANRLVKDVNDSTNLTRHVTPFVLEVKNDPNILAGSSAGQQLKRLQDDIILAEGNLKTQEQTLTGTEKLFNAKFVSELDLDRDILTLKNRQFSLDNARISLALFFDYDFPKNVEQYISNHIEDKRSLQRVYAQCRSRLAQAQSRLNTAETRYQDQLAVVALQEKQIENCILRAKGPGLVVYGTGGIDDQMRAMVGRGGGSGGSRMIAEGEAVQQGQVLISVPDTTMWIAEISVHETEVDKVRVGQPAVIVFDAFPDETLRGEVTEVAPLPDQQRGYLNPDLKVYRTLVRIDGSQEFLKSRMSCKVDILIDRLENKIVVPITVVANRSGQKICWVVTPQGSSQERVVRTGKFNDKYVEIIEGLDIGEKVLLNPPLITETAVTASDSFGQIEPLPPSPGNSGFNGNGDGMRGMRRMGGGEFNPEQMEQPGGRRTGRGMRGASGTNDGQTEVQSGFGGRRGQGRGGMTSGGVEGAGGSNEVMQEIQKVIEADGN